MVPLGLCGGAWARSADCASYPSALLRGPGMKRRGPTRPGTDLPHLLELELLNTGLVRGDGRALQCPTTTQLPVSRATTEQQRTLTPTPYLRMASAASVVTLSSVSSRYSSPRS